ncbi:MAG: endonuclease/exonuclease/phosphatase [Ponticaulis sp.]|nr:endonuclease/exonuclease/phosphatase [Ponticaulis sp.]
MMRFAFGDVSIPNLRDKLTRVTDAEAAQLVDEAFNVLSEDDRTLTAQALAASKADICLLQEVENLVTLTAFHNRYLRRWSRAGYAHRILKEGNDTRGIDVAALSRFQPERVISHSGLTLEKAGVEPSADQSRFDLVFRRDCLQLDYRIEGKPLTIFVCHFKSMHGSRWETRAVREQESLAVRRLIERSFPEPSSANWIVCGDLNDFLERDGIPDYGHGLGALVEDGFAVDALIRSDHEKTDRWTHFYSGDGTYAALDHFLLSPALAERNPCPQMSITRCGLPWRVERYTGFRLPGIAWSRPKASDHCPLSLELVL